VNPFLPLPSFTVVPAEKRASLGVPPAGWHIQRSASRCGLKTRKLHAGLSSSRRSLFGLIPVAVLCGRLMWFPAERASPARISTRTLSILSFTSGKSTFPYADAAEIFPPSLAASLHA